MPNPYNIPQKYIPTGVLISLENSQRHYQDSVILEEKTRYSSAIPLIILAMEEFGKTLWLSSKFESNEDVEPNDESRGIFRDHNPKINQFNEYLQSNGGSKTPYPFNQLYTKIQRVPDEQKFKLRLLYVDWNEYWVTPSYIYEFTISTSEDNQLFLRQSYEALKTDLEFLYAIFCNSDIFTSIQNAPKYEKADNTKVIDVITAEIGKKRLEVQVEGTEIKIKIESNVLDSQDQDKIIKKLKEHFTDYETKITLQSS